MGCSPSKQRPKPTVVTRAAESSVLAPPTQSPRFVQHCQTAAENPETPAAAVQAPFSVRDRFKMLSTPSKQGNLPPPGEQGEVTDLRRTLKKKQLIARVVLYSNQRGSRTSVNHPKVAEGARQRLPFERLKVADAPDSDNFPEPQSQVEC